MNVLLYHYGALGDFITLFPLLEQIRKLRECSSVTLLGKPEFGRIAIKFNLLDSILDADSSANRLFFTMESSIQLADKLSTYSLLIIFSSESSPVLTNCKMYFNGPIVHQVPFPSVPQPITDYHLSILRVITDVAFQNQAILKKDALNKSKTVFIHPGSGSTIKNWPMEKFLEIATYLRLRDYEIRWISGPAEENMNITNNDIIYKHKSLETLCDYFIQGGLYIGNDSGITHLAAFCGCDIVAIFGPSDPQIWAPKGHGKIIIVSNKLQCSPCHLVNNNSNATCKNSCMENITVEQVITELVKIIS
jgi:ADP-heptose:LPS heptosyltransferase